MGVGGVGVGKDKGKLTIHLHRGKSLYFWNVKDENASTLWGLASSRPVPQITNLQVRKGLFRFAC